MTILVTGGAGFIGSNLVDRLLKDGHFVICVDNFDDFYSPDLKEFNIEPHLKSKSYRLIRGNVCDRTMLEREVFDAWEVEAIVHLAARAGVRPSIESPNLYWENNAVGTLNLLELARKYGVFRFISASSSSVYGESRRVPFSEEDVITRPVSPYAASKTAGESLCYTYSYLYGIPVVCLRFFSVYGPRQRPDMAIHKFVRLISKGLEIPVYGDGTSSRDYTFVDDVVEGIVSALNQNFGFEAINLGDSSPVPLLETIKVIENALGEKAKINWFPWQPGEVPVTYANISKAQRLLWYNPKVGLVEGVQRFVSWFRNLPPRLRYV